MSPNTVASATYVPRCTAGDALSLSHLHRKGAARLFDKVQLSVLGGRQVRAADRLGARGTAPALVK